MLAITFKVESRMSKQIKSGENGKDHPPVGDGIPDGLQKPSTPAGVKRPSPKPKSKDGDVEEDGRGRLTRGKKSKA